MKNRIKISWNHEKWGDQLTISRFRLNFYLNFWVFEHYTPRDTPLLLLGLMIQSEPPRFDDPIRIVQYCTRIQANSGFSVHMIGWTTPKPPPNACLNEFSLLIGYCLNYYYNFIVSASTWKAKTYSFLQDIFTRHIPHKTYSQDIFTSL